MSELVIKPQKKFSFNLKELWSYKELLYYFAWRDIKVRYKQTLIGASWAVVQPIVTMVVFTLFFSGVIGIKSDSIPYAIFSYSGLLFWDYFSGALSLVSNSLVANQSMITKVYFPRIIVPVSATLLGIIDFFFASLVFAGLMVYFKVTPGLTGILLIFPMLLLTLISALGLGTLLAALNVKYRDVRAAVPFIVQLGLFLTPVIYPVSLIPGKYQWLLYLNPVATVINTMRAGLLGQGTINWVSIGVSSLIALVMLVLGVLYFRKTEREFADII